MRSFAGGLTSMAMIVGVGAACGLLADREEAELLLTTDRTEYVVARVSEDGVTGRYGFAVEVRLENRGRVPIYLGRCGPESTSPIHGVAFLDAGAGGLGHHSAYVRGWTCPDRQPAFRVEPGEVRIDTLRLRGPNRTDGHTGVPIGALEGRMKLFYLVQECAEPEACAVTEDVGSSNPFQVILPAHLQAARFPEPLAFSRSSLP